MRVQSLGQEDPLEKRMATCSSILAWRIPWTEEPGRLKSIGSQRVRHNWSDLACTHMCFPHACMRAKWVQWCLILCDPRDCSPQGSSVLGIPQARILEQDPVSPEVSPSHQEASISLLSLSEGRQNENHNHRKLIKLSTWTTAQWNYEPCHVGPPKKDGS